MSNGTTPTVEPPVTTYTTADGQTVQVPGQGVRTTLDTPAALDAEMRAAFESAEYRTQTTAALLSDGVNSVDPRSDPAAAAAMAAAVGAPVLPDPTVDPTSPIPATAASVAAAASAPTSETPTATAPPFAPPSGGPEVGSETPPPVSEPTPGPSDFPPPDPALDGYDFRYVDPATQTEQVRHLSDREIAEAIGLRGWVNNLTDQQKAAIAALESGQARAIAAADYDRYQAWVNAQQSGHDGRVGNLGVGEPTIDYNDLDPQTAAQVQAIERQNQLLQQQLYNQQVADAQQAAQQAASYVDQNLAAKAQAYDTAANEYAAQRGLTPNELNALAEAAMRAEIVPIIERKYTVLNPVNNQIVQPADSRQVVFEALDYALWQNQGLYQSVEARQHAQQTTASPPLPNNGQPSGGNPATPPAAFVPGVNGAAMPDIAAKKARAASLATAPSSAVTPVPLDVTKLSREQTAEAMAGDIARYWQQQ